VRCTVIAALVESIRRGRARPQSPTRPTPTLRSYSHFDLALEGAVRRFRPYVRATLALLYVRATLREIEPLLTDLVNQDPGGRTFL